MRRAEASGTDDCPVKIKLVAPPLYVLTTQTLDKVCNGWHEICMITCCCVGCNDHLFFLMCCFFFLECSESHCQPN